ncbi:hypothetical protein JCM10212_004404 [Sporobolomyces blumeae]
MSHQLICVVGSTGNQGGGVLSALLESSSPFKVRALTRDPASSKGQCLVETYSHRVKEGRLELVQGDLEDVESLEKAFEGCYGVFAAFGPGAQPEEGQEAEEVRQGKNLVNAAKAAGIEHFVYSSLSSINKESEGKITNVYHHESKAAVADYAKQHLKNVTTVQPPAFYSNLASPGWTRRAEDGTAVFCAPFKPTVRLAWIDDRFDIGSFVAAIFKKGPKETRDKAYFITSGAASMPEIANEYHKITGETVSVEPLSVKEGADKTATTLGVPHLAEELNVTFEWFNQIYDNLPKEALDGAIQGVAAELGVKASSFAQFLERSGWRVGQ